MKVTRRSRVVPQNNPLPFLFRFTEPCVVLHRQSSIFSLIGQNASIANVSRDCAHVVHSRLAARFGRISAP